MSKGNIIAILLVIILIFGALIALTVLSFPQKADDDDIVFEKVGGDDFLNVTLKYRLKISEKDIPDGSFDTSSGVINYYGAKNISYVDTFGNKDYFIIWKTTTSKYDWVDTTKHINQYVSCYLTGNVKGKCFVEYGFEEHYVYGVMVSTEVKDFSEATFIYDILGLNRSGFDLTYSSTSYAGGSHSSGSGGYHTVVPDRYTLSRTDPGSYYDHYEYGDNYDIDDYLESQGYD